MLGDKNGNETQSNAKKTSNVRMCTQPIITLSYYMWLKLIFERQIMKQVVTFETFTLPMLFNEFDGKTNGCVNCTKKKQYLSVEVLYKNILTVRDTLISAHAFSVDELMGKLQCKHSPTTHSKLFTFHKYSHSWNDGHAMCCLIEKRIEVDVLRDLIMK